MLRSQPMSSAKVRIKSGGFPLQCRQICRLSHSPPILQQPHLRTMVTLVTPRPHRLNVHRGMFLGQELSTISITSSWRKRHRSLAQVLVHDALLAGKILLKLTRMAGLSQIRCTDRCGLPVSNSPQDRLCVLPCVSWHFFFCCSRARDRSFTSARL